MKERFQRFMLGRHGVDDLGQLMNIVIIALLVLSLFLPQISPVVTALTFICIFRMFSRNTHQRSAENEGYLRLKKKAAKELMARRLRFKNRKIYRYFRCPKCRQLLRTPRGKGKTGITCPKCHTAFETRS